MSNGAAAVDKTSNDGDDDDVEGKGGSSDEDVLTYEFGRKKDKSGQQMIHAVGYLHTSVIRAREDVNENDEPINTFLAEVDLTQSLCFSPSSKSNNNNNNNIVEEGGSHVDVHRPKNAHLVLGLNNHHVGSYYWARSAGMGSSMEAPGISFESLSDDDERGIIRWEKGGGPLECNSNDGKRSEWVNFLRIGDNVQLLPLCEEGAMMAFLQKFGYEDETCGSRIYGISSKGRPLGSEPMVICRWVSKT